MNPANDDQAVRLRSRARLLEFLKFRVLASQEAFFDAWRLPLPRDDDPGPTGRVPELPPLDLEAFRAWLQPLWPEVAVLSDSDLRCGLEQAYRLYVDPPVRRRDGCR